VGLNVDPNLIHAVPVAEFKRLVAAEHAAGGSGSCSNSLLEEHNAGPPIEVLDPFHEVLD
jgi:hypothetical protein